MRNLAFAVVWLLGCGHMELPPVNMNFSVLCREFVLASEVHLCRCINRSDEYVCAVYITPEGGGKVCSYSDNIQEVFYTQVVCVDDNFRQFSPLE